MEYSKISSSFYNLKRGYIMDTFLQMFDMWDFLLMVVVAGMAILLSYIPNPQIKAFMITLPGPFTVATLSVGMPLGAVHVSGLILLLLYTHCVRILHKEKQLPIILSIVISASGYCVGGMLLARVLPETPVVFWSICAFAFGIAAFLYFSLPEKKEPAYKTNLSVWIKGPLVIMLVTFLIVIKKFLKGSMVFFPMVGVFAAYESRFSLWTLTKYIPVLMLVMTPMLAIIYLFQGHIGLGPALGIGWIVYLILLVPFLSKLRYTVVSTTTKEKIL